MNDGRTPAWRAAGFCQPPAPPRLSIKRKGPLAGPDEENDMRLLIASLLALAMMPAMADFSFRFGDSVVTTGDSPGTIRSEEHTSELQSLMRNSYAAFCLKK